MIEIELEGLGVKPAHVAEYFGPWAILEDRFRAMADNANGTNLVRHIKTHQAILLEDSQPKDSFTRTSDGVAIIQVRGTLMKQDSSVLGGSSTIRLRQQVRQAAGDDTVRDFLAVGLNAERVAEVLGDKAEWVRDYAERNRLPLNTPADYQRMVD